MTGESDFSYFNYFTEVEEHFQRARGTSLFLLSPLDWALIESWKNSGVPLEAVLKGVDEAFEKWRARKSRVQMVNSLAYCAQAVMKEAQRMADGVPEKPQKTQPAPFAPDELRRYIEGNADALSATGVVEFAALADSLRALAAEASLEADLETLEQRLTTLEQKLVAIARVRQTEAEGLRVRVELETYLKPWRSRMSAPQIAMLETQFLERALLEGSGLPRLSLFYLA